MFFHILQKDLKRQRTMNVILLVFIIMASMFLASSVNNLVQLSGAVDHFIEKSNVPDFFTITVNAGEDDPLEDFIEKNDQVEEYQIVPMYNVVNEDIEIVKRAAEAEKKEYDKSGSMAVSALSDRFMKIFTDDGETLKLKDGEIAIPKEEANRNSLAAGDQIKIKVGDVEQKFTVKCIVKDAVFGSSMMGFKRVYISDGDFQRYDGQEGLFTTKIYNVNTVDQEKFMKEYRGMEFSTISNIDKSLVKMCYIMDMLVSAILIVVSICLILISFLILRFTIVFTLQEDYKQIGIMKAIGVKDGGIRNLYLVKYLAIAVVGSAVGFGISIPFGRMLMGQAMSNVIVEEGSQGIYVNLVCAVAIVLIVLLFCYGCTRRLKKITVMKAIREGSDGERYNAKNKMHLSRRKVLKPYAYMAWNDISSSFRRFLTLGLIFVIGTLLIQLPLMAVTTLQSSEIVKSFSLSTADAYVNTGEDDKYMVEKDDTKIINTLDDIRDQLKENGINAKVRAEVDYMIPAYSDDENNKFTYLGLQTKGDEGEDYDILEGEYPKLPNEIMITEKTANEMGVGIGDTVHFCFSDDVEDFVITGIYQSMVNMGNGYRFSATADLDYSFISGIIATQVDVADMDSEAVRTELKELYPDYEIKDYTGYMKTFMGSIIGQLDALKTFIMLVIFIINSLITVLIMKSIITKEHGEIAMLKSIGFSNVSIRAWQTMRILIILIGAIVVGTILSKLLAPVTIGLVFSMMGANRMHMVTNPFEAYLFYPGLLLLVTGLASFLCAGEIGRVDVKEVNNLE